MVVGEEETMEGMVEGTVEEEGMEEEEMVEVEVTEEVLEVFFLEVIIEIQNHLTHYNFKIITDLDNKNIDP